MAAVERADKTIEKILAPPIEMEAPKEKEYPYHVIKLHAKRHDHDSEIVHVHVGCANRDWDARMRRNELIPVEEPIVEALRHTTYPQYRMPTDQEMLEGRSEKITGEIQRFTFDLVFRDIPKDVFLKLRQRAMDPAAKPITEKEIEAMLGKGKN